MRRRNLRILTQNHEKKRRQITIVGIIGSIIILSIILIPTLLQFFTPSPTTSPIVLGEANTSFKGIFSLGKQYNIQTLTGPYFEGEEIHNGTITYGDVSYTWHKDGIKERIESSEFETIYHAITLDQNLSTLNLETFAPPQKYEITYLSILLDFEVDYKETTPNYSRVSLYNFETHCFVPFLNATIFDFTQYRINLTENVSKYLDSNDHNLTLRWDFLVTHEDSNITLSLDYYQVIFERIPKNITSLYQEFYPTYPHLARISFWIWDIIPRTVTPSINVSLHSSLNVTHPNLTSNLFSVETMLTIGNQQLMISVGNITLNPSLSYWISISIKDSSETITTIISINNTYPGAFLYSPNYGETFFSSSSIDINFATYYWK